MDSLEPELEGDDPEIVHWYPPRHRPPETLGSRALEEALEPT